MEITELIKKDDIIRIGISEKENVLAKVIEEPVPGDPSYKFSSIGMKTYSQLKLSLIPNETNNIEWFTEWIRSYVDYLAIGKTIWHKFTQDIYVWRVDANKQKLCRFKMCIIRSVYFNDLNKIDNETELSLYALIGNDVFTNDNLVKRGKELSFLLRHDKDYHFDEHGYREVSDLICNHNFTMELLENIVETNDKQRYEFSDDKTKIRARQGHSVDVDVDLKECTPPDVLYHGTASRFIESIEENGINSGTRKHVHLSSDKATALNVGNRHGRPCIIVVDTKRMADDGIKFYLSNNNVWLTEFVDKKYISEVIINAKNIDEDISTICN